MCYVWKINKYPTCWKDSAGVALTAAVDTATPRLQWFQPFLIYPPPTSNYIPWHWKFLCVLTCRNASSSLARHDTQRLLFLFQVWGDSQTDSYSSSTDEGRQLSLNLWWYWSRAVHRTVMSPTATTPVVMSNGLPLTSTFQSDHTDKRHAEEKSVKWTIVQILSGIFIICLIPYLHIGKDACFRIFRCIY